jgi:hypothetical protein
MALHVAGGGYDVMAADRIVEDVGTACNCYAK